MAKQSARSKGYRKYKEKTWWQKKTPEEQKKWIRTGLIAAAAVLVIVLLIVFVPKGIEWSRRLKVVDGAVDTKGENWLVINLQEKDHPAYHRLARIEGAAEGYAFDRKDSSVSDTRLPIYIYRSETTGEKEEYYVQSSIHDARETADTYLTRVPILGEPLTQTEVTETTVNGRRAYWLSVTYSYPDRSSQEEEPPTLYMQSAILYIESTAFDGSAAVNYMRKMDDENDALSDEEVGALLMKAAETVVMDER